MVTIRKPVSGLSAAALTRFLSRAQRAVNLPGEIDLLITSDAAIRTLNRKFRHKDKPTDVLSFPSLGMKRHAGDVAISAQTAARQAKAMGHSVANEIQVLVLHGVLHLAGYDHETDDGKMARVEARLRHKLGLRAGLIERAAGASKRAVKKRGHA